MPPEKSPRGAASGASKQIIRCEKGTPRNENKTELFLLMAAGR
ncbi:hypothetical protein CLOLEP_01136 [[Clostridium] leptum DSM 753]|uniref:Uncharacterized protein n=1 Tax=[Clostridium] leptum DSM 753 TaxID=428125 RepID=A7VRF3_9FIRM|nr:hypothetical protein CLOLEP_01136 [[Clostridium] leptum DSM 753]